MKIRFSTEILRRLGEELNPSLDKGILELVKNSYDADAVHCTVELVDTDGLGGHIVIFDDGDGMTPSEIENGWLVLGRSMKSQGARTRLGRIPAGSKGLGRLAALRMGEQVLLTTHPANEKRTEYNLLIDWTDYENVELVDEVLLNLEKSFRLKNNNSGTEIRLERLRMKIGRRDVKRLARELILLAGPFVDDPTGFKPVLCAPEFRDFERLVKRKYYDDADYHLVAQINGKGSGRVEVLDGRGGVLFSATHEELVQGREQKCFRCPALRFELWSFLLSKGRYGAQSVPKSHISDWLQAFGGVHLYQNGLRVTPYGDPGNDWLDMNLSRVRSPEERPSTNNSIGRVIFEDQNALLVQKTDRSGFIETEAFREIREFCQIALDWMARKRLEEAEKRREREKAEARGRVEKTWNQLSAAVEKLPKNTRETMRRAADQTKRSVDKHLLQLEQEIQLYRTLSTAGITSATFAHESAGNPIKVIKQSLSSIKRRAELYAAEVYKEWLEKPLTTMTRAADSLSVLGDATLKLLDHEKRRIGRVDVHIVIRNILDTFQPFLTARQIDIESVFCEGSPYFRGTEAAIESIVTNLLNNCVAAFESGEALRRDRKVRISTTATEGTVQISVADNGPGINGISSREIWLPGRTTRKHGTGLGLTIVKDTTKDLGGEVGVAEHGELGGAEIFVSLPILGV